MITLQPHQVKAIDNIVASGGSKLIEHGVGTGKTLTSIMAALKVSKGGMIDVIAPASLKENFQQQIAKGVSLRDRKMFNVLGYEEAMRHPRKLKGDTLIVDEAHRLRNPSSKGHKFIKGLKHKNKILLSATPSYNTPMDRISLVSIIEDRMPSVFRVQREFNGHVKKTRRNISDTLRYAKRLAERGTDTYLNPPKGGVKKTTVYQEVPLTGKEEEAYGKYYRALPEDLKSVLQQKKAPSSKHNPFFYKSRVLSNSDNKIKAIVKDTLKSPGKTLIYSNYVDKGVNRLAKALKEVDLKVVTHTGKKSKEEKDNAVLRYNAGLADVLIVSSSGGEGLNLKETRQVLITEPHFNNKKIEQVIGRAIRVDSHDNLPEKDRNVKVIKYVTVPKRFPSFDKYMYQMGDKKEKLDTAFKDI